MKTLNIMLSNLGGRVVPIGYEGENLYTRIRINCIEVFSEYPDATVSMVVSPPDGEMYPAVVEKSGVMVIWDITDSVLSSNGSGECQLTFTEGDVVRKSVVFGISINRSLVASGEAPEPVQEWIDRAEQTAQEIAENAAMLAKQDIVESYGEIAPAIIETASGAIASFSDGADGMLVKKLTVDIDPVQEGSGDPSPDNVRPISGWDSANVSRTGKNLFDKTKYTKSGWTLVTDNPFKKNTVGQKITFSINKIDSDAHGFSIVAYNGSQSVATIIGYTFGYTDFETTVTLNQAIIDATTIQLNGNWNGLTADMVENAHFQIEISGTKTNYETPNVSEIEYEFPQAAGTVYGGTLTIHQDGSGELVADRETVAFPNNHTFNLETNQNRRRFEFNTSDYGLLKSELTSISSHFKLGRPENAPFGYFYLAKATNTTYFTFYDGDSKFASASELETWLQDQATNGTPVQVTFELAEPVTYQLTNQQVIALLKGSNNIWADTGDVALEYPADTKLYIDGKVAELQALILENISNS